MPQASEFNDYLNMTVFKVLVKVMYNLMRKVVKRFHRTRTQVFFFIAVMMIISYCHFRTEIVQSANRRKYAEDSLEQYIKLEKGTGCKIPNLDPFHKDVYNGEVLHPLSCSAKGRDWVKCYQSTCRIVKEIRKSIKNVTCHFSYILYHTDVNYEIGPSIPMNSDGIFRLIKSDYAKVSCSGINIKSGYRKTWSGNAVGLRTVKPKQTPEGREWSYNVMILCFDSTPKNGFIRRMPLSWKVLTEELGATVMHGFNVLGDGTPATLFPLLTGKSEFELPDVRKRFNETATLDSFPFIFYRLKEDGYRTTYFEDTPQWGTFQYRFNGFQHQPANHYLRPFFLEELVDIKWYHYFLYGWEYLEYCVGDMPRFKLMLSLTEQFLDLGGKRFALTFIADISHRRFDTIQWADEDTAAFLRNFRRHSEDTMLVVMGDHGPRFSEQRESLNGKLEERLPLLAILLPKKLCLQRPSAPAFLKANGIVLTTPHDLHATVLDVLGMLELRNTYKVKGADMMRGLTMLQPIPASRSCSEAGVQPHWCACARWETLEPTDKLREDAAQALLLHLNQAVKEVGDMCVERTITSIGAVYRQRFNKEVLQFKKSIDPDGYRAQLTANTTPEHQNIQVQIVTSPGRGVFEATMSYKTKEKVFEVDRSYISRISPYNNEPDCISKTHPHLNPYCYCK